MTWVKIVVTKLPHAMIINELKVIKLFCELDDFTQALNKKIAEHMLGKKTILNLFTSQRLMCQK